MTWDEAVGLDELGEQGISNVLPEATLRDADANKSLIVVGAVDGGDEGRFYACRLLLKGVGESYALQAVVAVAPVR